MFNKFANAARSLKEKTDVGAKLEATKRFMFKKFADAARSLKEKADIGAKLEATKQLATGKYEAGKAEASVAWDKHWPAAEHLLVEGLLSIAEEKLRDDKALESVFGTLYETLPLPVRLGLSRHRFVELIMACRDPLLVKVQDARAQRQTTPPTQEQLDSPRMPDA